MKNLFVYLFLIFGLPLNTFSQFNSGSGKGNLQIDSFKVVKNMPGEGLRFIVTPTIILGDSHFIGFLAGYYNPKSLSIQATVGKSILGIESIVPFFKRTKKKKMDFNIKRLGNTIHYVSEVAPVVRTIGVYGGFQRKNFDYWLNDKIEPFLFFNDLSTTQLKIGLAFSSFRYIEMSYRERVRNKYRYRKHRKLRHFNAIINFSKSISTSSPSAIDPNKEVSLNSLDFIIEGRFDAISGLGIPWGVFYRVGLSSSFNLEENGSYPYLGTGIFIGFF